MFGENSRHVVILITSLIFSFGGIVAAAQWDSPSDGGRGGAVAVAISLFALFANKPRGKRIFGMLVEERKRVLGQRSTPETKTPSLDRLAIMVDAIITRIDVDTDGQNKQNLYMATAAFIGTIAWGFGDWAASVVIAQLGKLLVAVH
ncbi:MAG: hypothetical protein AB7G35_07310 [Hyphomicrobiaceae bacterium]